MEELEVVRRAIDGMLKISALWMYSGAVEPEHMAEATVLLKGHGNLCAAMEALGRVEALVGKFTNLKPGPPIPLMLARIAKKHGVLRISPPNETFQEWCLASSDATIQRHNRHLEAAIRSAYSSISHNYLKWQETGEILDTPDSYTWEERVTATDEHGVKWQATGLYVHTGGGEGELQSVSDIEKVEGC